MIKLCVPGRFEPELLDALEPIQRRTGRIGEVYGSVPSSVLGSARPTRRLTQYAPPPTLADVESFTDRAHRIGIEVNYVLNANVFDPSGYSREGRAEILRYVSSVADTGVDMVTITVPYLIELVRSELPDLPVGVSVINEVDSVNSLRLYEEYGVRRIMVAEECNRDLELLGLLSEKVKDAEIGLLLNNGCLRFCALRVSHFSQASMSSRRDTTDRYVDYPLLKCSAARAREPVEVLRSPWIRPEDLTFYEDRFGIEVFKIVGRQLPLERIVGIAAAYARGEYDGNFVDLLSSPSAADFTCHPTTTEVVAERGPGGLAPPPIHIDNGRLGRLTRALFARGGCDSRRDCDDCRLCDEVLPFVLTQDDPAERLEHAETLEELIEDLTAGRWSSDGVASPEPAVGARS